jgi:hypothetical protein
MNLSLDWMAWVHEISQSALAAAVAILGLVILLELRSIARLRSLVDSHLTRVFEQLDLLRLEREQPVEAQLRAVEPATRPTAAEARTAGPGGNGTAPYSAPALGAGEARLLAALAAARARIARGNADSPV